MVRPLDGVTVVDLSTGIAGGYCSKLLADAGAAVVKVDPPGGDPLRRWSASGAAIPPDRDGALFNFLHARSRTAGDVPAAEVYLWSRGARLSPAELRQLHPGAIVTAVTPFGLEGPWADKPATELTVQAWSGGVVGLARGAPDGPPVAVGGQIGEWLAGLVAAVGTLAALRRLGAHGDLVDVSMLEASALALTYYPVTFNDQLGRPMRKKRFVPTPGVAAAEDGLVGLGCGTGQQWLDFCAMVGHPEWTEDPKLFLERTALAPTIDAWVGARTVDEVLELASTFRIPNAPIVNGANAPEVEHFRARQNFVENPVDGARNPRPPVRFTTSPAGDASRSSPPRPAPDDLPCRGLRILDLTGFWAGPLAGHVLALLGAEVLHVESARRPDGARFVGGVPQSVDRYWERSPIFAALNTNKRSVAIDFGDQRGVDLLRRLAATCDAVVENYTPRVLDQAGLGYDDLRAVRPDIVMVRMPGFGLDGPWRDNAAFAFVIEDASGLTWLTGTEDRLPLEPYCVGDPNAGLHAVYGLLLALAHRERTGEGALVEAAMVDAALSIAAEQVVEHSAYGALLERQGNRGPAAAPQNLYRTAGPDENGRDDCWVAVAVATDEQWTALRGALGDPEWARDPALATAAGRRAAHDLLDEHLATWCRARSDDEVVDALWDAGVPVGKVVLPHRQADLPPMAARRFFEEVDHPVLGPARYSTLPVRFGRGPDRYHRRHAPLLGEHTREVLTDLGLPASEIDVLLADGVIGDTLVTEGAP